MRKQRLAAGLTWIEGYISRGQGDLHQCSAQLNGKQIWIKNRNTVQEHGMHLASVSLEMCVNIANFCLLETLNDNTRVRWQNIYARGFQYDGYKQHDKNYCILEV